MSMILSRQEVKLNQIAATANRLIMDSILLNVFDHNFWSSSE